MKFLDQSKIYIKSGGGGDGCLSFRREKCVEFGGPDGGNGGRGGHVLIECVSGLNTLIDYRYRQHFKAGRGGHGMGKNRTGGKGEDNFLQVPIGTQIFDEDYGVMLADLTEEGQMVMMLEGGHPGTGNAAFKSSVNQAPRRTTPGGPAEEMWIWLRLKLMADAGLVGLPNAGKSTFLSAVSRAKPKIADYPFTTLKPQLGVVHVDQREFVVADIPGLIEGAHEGHGLGDRFLGHIERCTTILHMIDATGDDVAAAYKTIRHELESYGGGLSEKPEIIGLNKCDALDSELIEMLSEELSAVTDALIVPISAVTHFGIEKMLRALLKNIDHAKEVEKREEARPADDETDKEGNQDGGWSPL
ncbi:MAG: GTPase ObgE [Emcibacter sp.]|nr:GTPase ObgE [Emcibacter sp.]